MKRAPSRRAKKHEIGLACEMLSHCIKEAKRDGHSDLAKALDMTFCALLWVLDTEGGAWVVGDAVLGKSPRGTQ